MNSNAVMFFIRSFTCLIRDTGKGEEKKDGQRQLLGIHNLLQILKKVNGMNYSVSGAETLDFQVDESKQ